MTSELVGGEPRATASEEKSAAPGGWMASLRARLGLAGPQTLRDSLEDALKDHAPGDGTFTAEEREILLRALRFNALRVEDVMVPRADIIAVEESEPLSELMKTFEEAGVSRVPIFHETLDDPRGMVHVKDLFQWLLREAAGPQAGPQSEKTQPATGSGEQAKPAAVPERADKPAGSDVARGVEATATPEPAEPPRHFLGRCDLSRPLSVAKIRRQVLFVPPSMPAINLLIRMQATRNHMALVVDEYGGTDGLVTIEDLVEQIVGDIEDEHDEKEAANMVGDPATGMLAAARTPVAELEARVGRKLLTPEEEEDIDTLGGLVIGIVGRVPARGEIVRHTSGLEFEVLDADARRVKKLRIHVPRSPVAPVEADAAKQAPATGAPKAVVGAVKASDPAASV